MQQQKISFAVAAAPENDRARGFSNFMLA